MNETLSHPGAIRLTALDFEKFKPFINPEGMDTTQIAWFSAGLERLFDLTWDKGIWAPAKCRKLIDSLDTVNEVFAPFTCEIKRWERHHYWWEVQNNFTLIIDPSGLLPGKLTSTLPLGSFTYQYVPYFGRPEFSGLPNREVYREGERLDSLGTEVPDFYYFR